MAPRDPVERARAVRGVVAAARLREELGFELGRSGLPFDREADLDQAIGLLEERFPEVRDVTNAEEFAAEKGAGSRDGIRAKAARGERGPDAAALERAARGAGGASRRAGARSASSKGRAGGRRPAGHVGKGGRRTRVRAGARRAFERTGVPRAARSTTQIALQGIGLTLGLSLLYLLLSNGQRAGRGGSLLEQIGRWITGSTRALVAPVDPLGKLRAASSGEGGGGPPARQVGAWSAGIGSELLEAAGVPGGKPRGPRPGGRPGARGGRPNNRGPGRRPN
jgi:hypothetical protein